LLSITNKTKLSGFQLTESQKVRALGDGTALHLHLVQANSAFINNEMLPNEENCLFQWAEAENCDNMLPHRLSNGLHY
jgi:hypothetical protein